MSCSGCLHGGCRAQDVPCQCATADLVLEAVEENNQNSSDMLDMTLMDIKIWRHYKIHGHKIFLFLVEVCFV